MSMNQDPRRPGPAGTSCLTCKRRRKKCDKIRPACERCTTSGYVCLGYGHLARNSLGSNPGISSELPSNEHRTQNLHSAQPSYTLSPNSLAGYFPSPLIPSSWDDPTVSTSRSANGYDSNSFSAQFDIIDSFMRPGCDSDSVVRTTSFETINTSSFWKDLPGTRLDSALPLAYHQSVTPCFTYSSISSARQGLSDRYRASVFLSPTGLSPVPNDVAQIIEFVISQQEQLINLSFFKINHPQITRLRELLLLRLQNSSEARSTMFLGCKIFKSLLGGTSAQDFPGYYRWLERIEKELYSTSDQLRISDGSQNRCTSMMEVAFLKLKLSNCRNPYQLLKSTTKVFLQIAQAEGILQPNSQNGSVSLAHVFASTRHELAHFIMLDITCSMLYAVPQTLKYDTSVSPPKLGFDPVEWGFGCPIEFQIALTDINTLFHSQQLAVESDWRGVEHRIKSWQPTVRNSADDQSQKTVARLALQESWRHMLLVYLYMAIGGSSGDGRVQASVRQVFQLIESIKPSEHPSGTIYCVPLYLVAGACARSEKQRTLARERLAAPSENMLWLVSGTDFMPVLDHLWHGAAVNGRPIQWRDYVHSRQIAYPIPV